MGENFVWGKSVGLFLIKILEIIKLAGSSLGFLWLPPWPEMAVAELSRAGQAVWAHMPACPGLYWTPASPAKKAGASVGRRQRSAHRPGGDIAGTK